MEFKDRLKQLRSEKGITLDMFVYDMNNKYQIELNKGMVSKWENGINEPSLKYASYLALYYDVSLDYLIGLTDVKTPARLLAYASKMKAADIPALNCPKNSYYISRRFNSDSDSDPEYKVLVLGKNNED